MKCTPSSFNGIRARGGCRLVRRAVKTINKVEDHRIIHEEAANLRKS